jgi:hypothetical protein
LYYTNLTHQFPDAYHSPSPTFSHNSIHAPRLTAPIQTSHWPIATPKTSLGSFWGSCTYFTQPTPSQTATYSFPRLPLICYSCGREGHITRNCFNSHSVNFAQGEYSHSTNYTKEDYYVDNNQLHADAVLSNYYDQNWYLDSGASSHITSQHAILELIDNNYIGQSVSTADGVFHKISGIGSTSVNSGSGSINLKQVLYVPSLTRNLISIGSLTDDGRMVLFTRKQCLILQDDPTQNILAVGDRDFRNRLYKFGPQLQANQLITNRSSMDASSEISI